MPEHARTLATSLISPLCTHIRAIFFSLFPLHQCYFIARVRFGSDGEDGNGAFVRRIGDAVAERRKLFSARADRANDLLLLSHFLPRCRLSFSPFPRSLAPSHVPTLPRCAFLATRSVRASVRHGVDRSSTPKIVRRDQL